MERVDAVAGLGAGWDGPGSQATEPASVEVARALIHVLSAWHTVSPRLAPQIVPSEDGGTTIVWREQGYALDVEVEPDGKITVWLHRDADGAEATWGYEDDAS